jgi:hypothetical protein
MSAQQATRTEDIKDASARMQKGMQDRAQETGSKTVQHTADVLKAQHEMMVDKKLVERFDRIGKRLEEIRMQSPQDFDRTKKQIESLRPLLRLSVRSVNFRNTFLSFLRILKHVWEQNVEGSVEDVLEKGEQQGEPALQEAKKIGEKTWDSMKHKEKVISDDDWNKMCGELEEIFSELHQHPNFQRGIKQLFDLPSVLCTQVQQNAPSEPVEKLKEESKDLIAQFSGREVLDDLFNQIDDLRTRFQDSNQATEWWHELRNLVDRISREYHNREIFDELRDHLNKSQDIFEDYRPQLNQLIDTLTDVFDNMSNDDYIRDLQERLSIVADDLYWVDSEGNKRLDVDAVGDVTGAIGEAIRQQLSHFSLGVVSNESQGVRYRLADLTIDSKIPEKLEVHLESDAVFNTARDTSSNKRFESEMNLTASLRGIQMCARRVQFWYESSTLSESGVMDVCIPSADLTIDFTFSPSVPKQDESMATGFTKDWSGSNRSRYFVCAKTMLSVSDLDINFYTETLKHSILSPVLTGLFKPYLIGRFEEGVQDAMNDGMKEVGNKISQLMAQSPYSLSIADTLTRGVTSTA